MLNAKLAKTVSLMLVAGAWMLAAGCSAIYSPGPVGEKPPNTPLDPAFWEGNWVVEDSLPVAVRVADAKAGDLKIATIDTDDKKSSFTMQVGRATLRQAAGDLLVLSTEDMDHPELHRWILAGALKADPGNGRAFLWPPDGERFKEWIMAKKLPGEQKGSDVLLGKTTPAMVDQITSGTTGLLRWDAPIILRKLKK